LCHLLVIAVYCATPALLSYDKFLGHCCAYIRSGDLILFRIGSLILFHIRLLILFLIESFLFEIGVLIAVLVEIVNVDCYISHHVSRVY
jgi:predicted membrane protein